MWTVNYLLLFLMCVSEKKKKKIANELIPKQFQLSALLALSPNLHWWFQRQRKSLIEVRLLKLFLKDNFEGRVS